MNLDSYRLALQNMGVSDNAITAFFKWHLANRWFFEEFEKKALEAIADGETRWSADGIGHVVRWGHRRKGIKTDFVVNNNYVAYFARIFTIKHPEHKEFFELRTASGIKRAA